MNTLPEQFEETMKQTLGSEFPMFLESLSKAAPTSIRLNPKKQVAANGGDSIPWTASGKYLTDRPAFTLDPHFHAGNYYVQEASSMFLEQAIRQTVNLTGSLNLLDLCAAPGGKSTHLLSLINSDSLLVSNEVIRSRANILSENIQKWGYPNVVVTNNDPEHFKKLEGFFDVIVVDAPCSGEGLFRKDPDAMQEWSPSNVLHCASRQKRILSEIWPSLKENGILIYCTCTFNELENEDNLLWLSSEKEVEFLPLQIPAEWNIEEISKGKVKGYRFFPHRVRGEGFFLSVVQKKEATRSTRVSSKNKLAAPQKKTLSTISEWIDESARFNFFQHEDFIRIFPTTKFFEMEFLLQHLKVVGAGTLLGELKHEKVIPSHALALSIFITQNHFQKIDLTYDQAIKYLRKDQFEIPESAKGYFLVQFENSNIGWVNNLGNRFNNLYPMEWRIRMASK